MEASDDDDFVSSHILDDQGYRLAYGIAVLSTYVYCFNH